MVSTRIRKASVLGLIAIVAFTLPAWASVTYATLNSPSDSGIDWGSRSQSIVVRTSGVGFVEYGFWDTYLSI